MKWRHKSRRAGTVELVIVTPRVLPDGTQDEAVTPLQFETVGGRQDTTVTFRVGEGTVLPPGMSLSIDGVLSGTPTVPGVYQWMVEAIDGA